jgi:hypothetical protein
VAGSAVLPVFESFNVSPEVSDLLGSMHGFVQVLSNSSSEGESL